jgi:hypothetical protein
MEQRAGTDARGTIGYVITQFHESSEFAALTPDTQKQYQESAEVVRSFRTKLGCTLDALEVSRIDTPVIQAVIEVIAKGRDGAPGSPTKANHLLRYLEQTLGWGKRYGRCTSNPAEGAREVKESGRGSTPKARRACDRVT